MVGDSPTFVFEEPGEYTVTLTVTILGISFEDTVTITVLRVPDRAFVEEGAQGAIVYFDRCQTCYMAKNFRVVRFR